MLKILRSGCESTVSCLIRRVLAAVNVVEESSCLYILSVSLDGNTISRALGYKMGLPSNDTLKMYRQPAPSCY